MDRIYFQEKGGAEKCEREYVLGRGCIEKLWREGIFAGKRRDRKVEQIKDRERAVQKNDGANKEIKKKGGIEK